MTDNNPKNATLEKVRQEVWGMIADLSYKQVCDAMGISTYTARKFFDDATANLTKAFPDDEKLREAAVKLEEVADKPGLADKIVEMRGMIAKGKEKPVAMEANSSQELTENGENKKSKKSSPPLYELSANRKSELEASDLGQRILKARKQLVDFIDRTGINPKKIDKEVGAQSKPLGNILATTGTLHDKEGGLVDRLVSEIGRITNSGGEAGFLIRDLNDLLVEEKKVSRTRRNATRGLDQLLKEFQASNNETGIGETPFGQGL